jgi:hypothetical protein
MLLVLLNTCVAIDRGVCDVVDDFCDLYVGFLVVTCALRWRVFASCDCYCEVTIIVYTDS